MKERNGFVSNSSSSNFICDIRYKEITGVLTIEKVREFMDDLCEFSKKHNMGLMKNAYKIRICTDDDVKELVNEWQYDDAKGGAGNVMISSTDDNSIPYHFFEMIEHGLNAIRFHLG